MSKVKAETPSRAQQNGIGIDSTKLRAGGLATAGGAPRTMGADGMLGGWLWPRRAVAFIGESPMRAVSLRGPVGRMSRFSTGNLAGGTPTGREGDGGAGVETGAGAGGFGLAGDGSDGGGGFGGRTGEAVPGGAGGRATPLGPGRGAGGRAIGGAGGRTAAFAGGIGLGATADGGRRGPEAAGPM